MQVKKAWQFLLFSVEKGYFTGYKGAEMFGDMDSAKVFRTKEEAYMATLGVKVPMELESVLIWHRDIHSSEESESQGSKENRHVNSMTESTLSSHAMHEKSKPGYPLRLVK